MFVNTSAPREDFFIKTLMTLRGSNELYSAVQVLLKWLGTGVPLVIAVGSLKTQKGFSYLLQALEIVNRTKTVRLIIIGDGDKKEQLQSFSKELSIKDKTDFLGAVANPFPYIAKADIFVCSSLYKGLSNVILEALALGKPIISTNHEHGADNALLRSGSPSLRRALSLVHLCAKLFQKKII